MVKKVVKKIAKKKVARRQPDPTTQPVIVGYGNQEDINQGNLELAKALTDLEGAFKQIELVLKRTTPHARVMLVDMIINAIMDTSELPHWINTSILTTSILRQNTNVEPVLQENRKQPSYIN